MDRPLSHGVRRELIQALRERYWKVTRTEKTLILNELVALTGHHRKHAIQMMARASMEAAPVERARGRLYDEVVREGLILLWEASDRVCSKRLKAMIPRLLDAMERHGHLSLDPVVRVRLETVSAATMDRLLRPRREALQKRKHPRPSLSSQVRPQVPVRTFADWGDPPPGFLEADLVTHGGPSMEGDFVHSIVFTDIATGWTECMAMPFRSSLLVVQAIDRLPDLLPFPLRGIDVDNGSEFLNEAMLDYCQGKGIVFTRGRPLHKNDQAWVEQKNSAIVRRMLGYDRLHGPEATEAVSRLYAAARLFVNYFQASFKLASKHRQGAKVVKRYHPPLTPCERLMAQEGVSPEDQAKLAQAVHVLDPLALLEEIRRLQKHLGRLVAMGPEEAGHAGQPDIQTFLTGLSILWKEGDLKPVRMTRRRRKPKDEWEAVGRPRQEAIEMVWDQVEAWLTVEPACSATAVLARLQEAYPALFSTKQIRSLQRRIKQWRSAYAKRLVFRGQDCTAEECG